MFTIAPTIKKNYFYQRKTYFSFLKRFKELLSPFADTYCWNLLLNHFHIRRVRIENDTQFTMAIIYIHANAAKHALVKDFSTYKWSSWHSIISNKPTSLLRDDVIEWFGSKEQCIKTHK